MRLGACDRWWAAMCQPPLAHCGLSGSVAVAESSEQAGSCAAGPSAGANVPAMARTLRLQEGKALQQGSGDPVTAMIPSAPLARGRPSSRNVSVAACTLWPVWFRCGGGV